MDEPLKLYSYWRSSAAYRVRIALNLKGLAYDTMPVHLVRAGGEQHQAAYAALNPQQLLPTFVHGEQVIRQSMAIIEYIDETWPSPKLLPATAAERARVRGLAQLVVSDVHPLNNLRVLRYFEQHCNVPQSECDEWIRHWIVTGFNAMEALLASEAGTGTFCHGEDPGVADCCLVPQVYNARRFEVDLDAFPMITRIAGTCEGLPAFIQAHPNQQPDAPEAG